MCWPGWWPWGASAASSEASACASTPPSLKPTFTTPPMPRSWPTGSACSHGPCGGSGSGSASARAVWRAGSSRSPSAVARLAAGCVREQSQAKMKVLYQGLMRIMRAVVRQAEAALARARNRHHAAQLPTMVELIRQVLAQTRARVLRGDTRYPGKVVSLFEPHTEIIRKGKLAKPTEFGRLVKIQEAEAQFITDYAVCEHRQSERALWAPALDRHIALFDRAPQLAVADGGFASRTNERAAQDRGVRHVVLPRVSREKRSRIARAALRWRTGSEGRISALKRRHGLRRCRYRGVSGMQRWVGLGVLANDLLALARAGP